MNNKPIAVIRIRGRSNVTKKINDTLDMLRLYKQNGCANFHTHPPLGLNHEHATCHQNDKLLALDKDCCQTNLFKRARGARKPTP